jgi:Family of unknown function (DUF6496)
MKHKECSHCKHPAEEKKIKKVMHEFGEGKLHSGSKHGAVVKNRAQALAIGYSEAKKRKK